MAMAMVLRRTSSVLRHRPRWSTPARLRSTQCVRLQRIATIARHSSGIGSQKKLETGLEAPPCRSLSTLTNADDNSSQPFRSTYCGLIDGAAVGDSVKISGWVHSYRNLGKHGIVFAVIRDWTGAVQVTWQSAESSSIGLEPRQTRIADGVTEEEDGPLLGLETVVTITGTVRERPANMVNPDMRTGSIEIDVESVEVLNHASEVPVEVKASVAKSKKSNIDAEVQSEDFLLRHRHLQLRMPHLQRNVRVRSDVTSAVRNHLASRDFIEVETPILFKSTPEGAREFIVPTKTAEHFYALPQSPQQFKQLLMVGGIDRYFQIARCFRDESGRADRQPEFTQIDMEMSFVDREGIMSTAEALVLDMFSTVNASLEKWQYDTDISAFALPDLSKPLPRMTFRDAMTHYGVDKPDTRFGMKLVDVSAALLPGIATTADGGSNHFSGPNGDLSSPTIQALRIPGVSGMLSRKQFDHLARQWESITAGIFSNKGDAGSVGNLGQAADAPEGAEFLRNLSIVRVKTGGDGSSTVWQSPVAKHVGEDAIKAVSHELGATDGDVIVLAVGKGWEPHTALGRLRLAARDSLQSGEFGQTILDIDAAEAGLSQPASKPPSRSDLLWVVDFPMFEALDEEEWEGVGESKFPQYMSSHHPFTAPAPQDAEKLLAAASVVGTADDRGEILSVAAQHYDLVLNGCEIAGGSVRIHDASMQQLVFDKILQIPKERQETFQHLLAALRQGAPPHAGIAFGLDRLMSMFLGTDSIRDVIAFPKSAAGRDLMTGAPAPVTDDQLAFYHQVPRNST